MFDSHLQFLKEAKIPLIFATFEKIVYINENYNEKMRKSEQLIYHKDKLFNESTVVNKQYDEVLINYVNKEFFYNYSNKSEEVYNMVDNIFEGNNFILWTEGKDKN